MDIEQKKLVSRLVAQILITDLVLTDAEGEFLDRLMRKLGLDAVSQREVKTSVNLDQPIAELVDAVLPENRQRLLQILHEAAQIDGTIGDSERELIQRVVKELAHG